MHSAAPLQAFLSCPAFGPLALYEWHACSFLFGHEGVHALTRLGKMPSLPPAVLAHYSAESLMETQASLPVAPLFLPCAAAQPSFNSAHGLAEQG